MQLTSSCCVRFEIDPSKNRLLTSNWRSTGCIGRGGYSWLQDNSRPWTMLPFNRSSAPTIWWMKKIRLLWNWMKNDENNNILTWKNQRTTQRSLTPPDTPLTHTFKSRRIPIYYSLSGEYPRKGRRLKPLTTEVLICNIKYFDSICYQKMIPF